MIVDGFIFLAIANIYAIVLLHEIERLRNETDNDTYIDVRTK